MKSQNNNKYFLVMYYDFVTYHGGIRILYSFKQLGFYCKIILNVVICVLAPAYTSLCRDLKYLPKDRYVILVDPNEVGFLIDDLKI